MRADRGRLGAGEPRPALILPTYNHAGTLIDVLERAEALGLPLLVVDDGSTDATATRLAAWVRDRGRRAPVSCIHHDRNRGKAAALRSGFAAARRAGHSHAVTLDSDGQHDPEQVPALLDAARRSPGALVVGARRSDLPGCPRLNLLGRRLSNLGLWLVCGVRVADSQCGMRVYPLDLVGAVPCPADRYAYEVEILAQAVWAGRPLVEVPVRSRYPPRAERISHYRPWRDTLACARTQARLLLGRLVPPKGLRGVSPRRGAVRFVDRFLRSG